MPNTLPTSAEYCGTWIRLSMNRLSDSEGTHLIEEGGDVMSENPHTMDIMSFGAVADGTADCTVAFQTAVDACAEAGGGIVAIPPGRFRFDGTLIVPEMVTLRGAGGAVDGIGEPTVLEVFSDADNFIRLKRGAGVQYVHIVYPEQSIDPAKIREYPFTIKVAGDNAHIIGVSLLNPYDGIDLSQAQRHLVRDVHGNPLNVGLYVDQCYDVGRIENVHYWPFISNGDVVQEYEKLLHEWLLERSRAFVFGRTDWEYVFNTFCWGYRVGYHFIETEHGSCNGNFQGIGGDANIYSLLVEQCNDHTGGLLISNAEFVALWHDDCAAVVIGEKNRGTVSLSNCGVWGPSDCIVKAAGEGRTTITGCNFIQWDKNKAGSPAIDCRGGSLILSGTQFAKPMNPDAPVVALREGMHTATVFGNIADGNWTVLNEIGENARIDMNTAT